MGQRANYIFKDGNKLTIHYNHWRANTIASDLYLGEKRFLDFVKECQLNDEIINEPWIEGCVIIDNNIKSLYFWTFGFTKDTSVIDYYLNRLSEKWGDWNLFILKNRMYDVEKILAIDYIAKQELQSLEKTSFEDIISDKVDKWITALVIIKQNSSIFVTKTGNLGIESIINYGQEVLSLIRNKPKYDLPKEGEEGTYECIVIDEDNKKVFANESIFGLVETSKELWKDYELIIGDFGYIETLRLANIETSDLILSNEEIKEQFSVIVQLNDSFDPFEMAEKLINEHNDIQFNPDFFDNVKPKKSLLDNLKTGIKKIWKRK